MIKQLDVKAKTVQLLSELVEVAVRDFLVRTQEYSVPYLILSRQRSVIQQIADASGQTLVRLCLQTLSAILAVLLTQPFDDVEIESMRYLIEMSDEFRKTTLASLVRSDPMTVAVEVLKMFDDSNDTVLEIDSHANNEKDGLLLRAMILISNSQQKISPKMRSANDTDPLRSFFETHILGIVSQLSDAIFSIKRKQVWTEKLRCLRGLGAAIKLARSNAVSAIPQICACLQSALEDPLLQRAALQAWMQMIVYFDSKEVDNLIGLTFSIILKNWSKFNQKSRMQSQHILEYIITLHSDILNTKNAADLPSFHEIPELQEYDQRISGLKRQTMIPAQTLDSLIRRCRHDNFSVVYEALHELQKFLIDQQMVIYTVMLNKSSEKLISRLCKTLIELCHRFSGNSSDIGRLAVECIGWIGAIDPNKLESRVEADEVVLVHNFEDKAETIDFVLSFLDKYLVPSFRASTDTKSQSFLAYGMQELLKFCGLDSKSVTERSSKDMSPFKLWHSLSGTSKLSLMPLLSSRYAVTNQALSPRQSYPIFRQTKIHKQWLQLFTLDLLSRANGENSKKLFAIFLRIIRDQNLVLSEFLLPFIVMNVIITGNSEERQSILEEMLLVLETRVDNNINESENDTIQQSYRTIFSIVDYINLWQRSRKKFNMKAVSERAKRSNRYLEPEQNLGVDVGIDAAESILSSIPVELIGQRAFECQSYARALFYYEQYIRKVQTAGDSEKSDSIYRTLQQIYSKLDDPDAVEGISTKFLMLDLDQQILEHEATGRWNLALQCWELAQQNYPENTEASSRLLLSLRESGNYGNYYKENLLFETNNFCKSLY